MSRAMHLSVLCEACGYVIEGLPGEGRCPECGVGVGSSSPARRPGTPWQRSPGVGSWVATNWLLVRRPRELFRGVRLERRSGTMLAAVNIALASALIVVPWTGTLIGDPARSARGAGMAAEMVAHGWVFAAQVALVGAALMALTMIECAGVMFFAARRGWRLTRTAAWQVCCHATAGWILCGLVPMLALASMFSAVILFRAAPGGTLDLRPVIATPLEWSVLVSGGALGLGYLGGLLAFEALVAIGARRCRFANAPEGPPPSA